MPAMHEIEYELHGSEMQYVEIILDPMEAVVAEAGGMMYMEDGVEMETIFGDGSQQQSGFMGMLTGGVKRLLTGESLFMTIFQNRSPRRVKAAFGAPYPGKILPLHLAQMGGEVILQKDSFLCGSRDIDISVAFQRNVLAGLFGGEGFILQRIRSAEKGATVLAHAGGALLERTLAAGESLRIDAGCVVAYEPSVEFDVRVVNNVPTLLFGGKGVFFATLTGPGRVWMQTMPFPRLASRIWEAAPQHRELERDQQAAAAEAVKAQVKPEARA